ncbi:uncharacterized protein MYCFIDRAFT_198430 [Pseudocercospora fijiensis CIRAD86]|uniref:Uncharacterized protein n=1 Tax=Pseudocercospora fijiensis (strain CIRAD86) TaxID=383855 RepID=M2ZM19_PSEFD|nr:uncharacterized protein MYCFIDRAFT_198430 [Pseudocercospora fijiensis CIRAD86]EME80114.1 hypothetical protein MYCFIDRAFT_198430 [Pseudocercospora fijiensis CIRAD86]
MFISTTLFAALLAGHFAFAYPLSARHEAENDSADNIVTVTHVVSLTTYVNPTTKSIRPTSTLTKTLYTTVQPKSGSTSASASADVNPINGLPVPPAPSSTSTTSVSVDPPAPITWFGPGPEPPNPTAKPSMYQTKPVTTSSSSTTSEAAQPSSSAKKSSSTPFETAPSETPVLSTTKTFEYPYPTKEPKTSAATKATSSSSGTWEYPYPTKESKTKSADDAKNTNCVYPYPGCDE